MSVHNPGAILCIVGNNRDAIKAWVNGVLQAVNLSASELAREAGVHQTTLTRFLNDPAYKNTLSLATITKIAAVANIEPFEDPHKAVLGPRAGLAEGVQGAEGLGATLGAAIENGLLRGSKGRELWTLKARSLEFAGYLPGDLLVIDMHERPKAGDVVCAELRRERAGRGEIVFRLFEPPYLIALNGSGPHRPVPVDDDLTIIRGVVTSSHRPRRIA